MRGTYYQAHAEMAWRDRDTLSGAIELSHWSVGVKTLEDDSTDMALFWQWEEQAQAAIHS